MGNVGGVSLAEGVDEAGEGRDPAVVEVEVVAFFQPLRAERDDGGFSDVRGIERGKAVRVVAAVLDGPLHDPGSEGRANLRRQAVQHGPHDVIVPGTPGAKVSGTQGEYQAKQDGDSNHR